MTHKEDWRDLTGARIKALRDRYDLDQREFGIFVACGATGLTRQYVPNPHQSTVARWESDTLVAGPLYGPAIMGMERALRLVAKWTEEHGGGEGDQIPEKHGLGCDQPADAAGRQAGGPDTRAGNDHQGG